MEKLYIVGRRRFTNEKSMKSYLLRMDETGRKKTKIRIYNLEKETTGDFIDSEIIQNKRDLQLKGLLEDNTLLPIIESIKLKVESNRPKDRYYFWSGDILINKISIVNDYKSLSDVVGNYGSFLFGLESSIEWYKILLQARSFQCVPIKAYDQEGEFFIKAKNEVKEEKLNKKKK